MKSAALIASCILCFFAAFDDEAARRRQGAREFHVRAQNPTGVIVPLYVYPANTDKNPAYSRLIELKRQYETVPMWVIVNPASGPGRRVDANYTRLIDRLAGAGCVTLGYVATGYGKRPAAEVRKEMDQWRAFYPRTHGIFMDEMIYDDAEAGVEHQAALSRYAHGAGFWPTVGNPGARTPARYFAAGTADMILIHEGASWPSEERLRAESADYPPFMRGILVHSQPALDMEALKMARKYARWLYVTEGVFRAGDPTAANPWNRLSKHLDEICALLSGP